MFRLTELDRRRIRNFRANKRAIWSLRIFSVLFIFSLFAEFVANDKPILISYRGEFYTPIWNTYTETQFNGEEETAADYTDPVVRCLIKTGGNDEACFDEDDAKYDIRIEVRERAEKDGLSPEETAELLKQRFAEVPAPQVMEGQEAGWMIRPLIPYAYDTVNRDVEHAISPPDGKHWLGTDDQTRDVVARIIYGFRLSVLFGFAVTLVSAVIGIIAGAAQGFFGGWVDLFFQRIEEVWSSMNTLYILLIVSSLLTLNVWWMFLIFIMFSWTALIGVVRAEFLRARNFEYVQAARALGVGDWKIMFRHLLPNAMVATLTMLPFMLTGSISLLAGLDFLGFGLGNDYPSLGELAEQANSNLQAPWLAISAFFTFAIMLSLMVFIFEGVRDAFDPRKTFK